MRELAARADTELPVRACQRCLDGVLRDEERRRDLAVRVTFGDELRDPALGHRQLVARRRTATDPRELRASLLDPERSADSLERGERLGQRRACRAALLRPPLRGTEHEQRSSALERILGPCVLGQCCSERDLGAIEVALGSE